MRMKTVDLTDAPLHYAVACMLGAQLKPNSIGAQHAYLNGKYIGGFITRTERGNVAMPHDVFAPSRVVVHGAEIGERILDDQLASLQRTETGWYAISNGDQRAVAHGETMRVAGLRAAVCAQLGETIDIPAWLV
ncbi:hypothetical protein [Duganella vulcania]|uniref:Uncharacterized protein n=1 Tax=Duganella vulcania TaxID=2692166 RepID=A0A845GGU9_9BURK|nr:hypothetical protein [Duganella vulcania]MYM92625.1 hypothetical protein [Duganella vulcania]